MSIPNWTDMQFYHYLIVAGAAVVVVALVLYFTPVSRLKIPAILMGIAGGFGAGTALGVIAMGALGYHWESREGSNSEQPAPNPQAMMMMRGQRGGGGGGGPNSKNRLTSVLTALDKVTTENGLKVTMDAEQKRKLREQIQTLDEAKELTEEEAKTKLDAVLGTLTQAQRDTLSEAGANWGQRGGGGGGGRGGRGGRGGSGDANANPFKEGEANRHLKSLREHMEEKSTK